ncbi:hypothetical protein ACN42_g10867 [Penicillium freii]|uniref:Uncharacterized protein n=1 Tax=Penicillium freii TaxID=48697 RepID=A0A101M9A5_PENFR|nr:hypothetical protein ACN42_g10867 [Penicillium freii]
MGVYGDFVAGNIPLVIHLGRYFDSKIRQNSGIFRHQTHKIRHLTFGRYSHVRLSLRLRLAPPPPLFIYHHRDHPSLPLSHIVALFPFSKLLNCAIPKSDTSLNKLGRQR